MTGAVRGVAAAMAMSGVRSVTTRLGIVRMTPPEEIGTHGGAALLARLPPHRRAAALELAHWGYGALGGVVFELLPARTRAVGIAYGLGLWGLFEAGIAPVLGAERNRPTSERLALAADHALYGLILSA